MRNSEAEIIIAKARIGEEKSQENIIKQLIEGVTDLGVPITKAKRTRLRKQLRKRRNSEWDPLGIGEPLSKIIAKEKLEVHTAKKLAKKLAKRKKHDK